jgi:hypothetical protein
MLRRLILTSAMIACALRASGEELLVLDRDAGLRSDSVAGSIFRIETTAPPSSVPVVVAQAPPFALISGLAARPSDGRLAVTDLGWPSAAPPTAYDLDCGRAVQVADQGAPLVAPFAATFLGDGRLVVADVEADPAALGSGSNGAHGAIYALDLDACPSCPPILVSDGTRHPFGPLVRTAFEDPMGIEWDPVSGLLYVVDPSSSAGSPAPAGRLFSVDPATGFVRLVSVVAGHAVLVSVTVRDDGTPIVVDQGDRAGTSVIDKIDLSQTDPTRNARPIMTCATCGNFVDAAIGASGDLYVVDWGDYDAATETFRKPPAIWRMDPANPDPATNAVLVNDSLRFVTPTQLVAPRRACPHESDCGNGLDDDGDSLTDCADPDCAFGAPCPRLAIDRAMTSLDIALVDEQFSCNDPAFTICYQDIALGDWGTGIVLPAEALPTGRSSLRFYEYSEPVEIHVRRTGSALVVGQ